MTWLAALGSVGQTRWGHFYATTNRGNTARTSWSYNCGYQENRGTSNRDDRMGARIIVRP